MSNLLNEAIVDAKALREAALKNAETVVIEKYSEEVRDTLNKLLEQEDDLGLALPGEEPAADLAADPAALDPAAGLEAAPVDPLAETEAVEGEELTEEEIPLAATDNFAELDGKNLKSFSGEGENVELNINLGALQEAVAALATELEEDEEYEITEEQLKEALSDEESLEELGRAMGKKMVDKIAPGATGVAADMASKATGTDLKGTGLDAGKRDDEDEVDEVLSPAIAAAMKAKGMSTDGAQVSAHSGGIADPERAKKMAAYKQKKIASLEQELKALGGRDPAKAKSIMKMIMAMKAKREGMAEEEIDEAAKPDFLDLDKDGDKKEPMKSAAKDAKKGDDDDEELEESDSMDSLVDAIMEKLTVDMGADLAGWAGRRQEDKVYQIEKEMARRVSTDVAEELENLKKAHEELVFESNQLAEQNNKYNEALQELKENLQDVNLSNARLLYTNRVLRNPSLNERQKDKIAEAISSAGSVTEAKTIFETLQSTVEAKPKKSPQSLSEAIGRRPSVLRATRKEEPSSDPLSERMKILAGIK
jgi:hypothetical protein